MIHCRDRRLFSYLGTAPFSFDSFKSLDVRINITYWLYNESGSICPFTFPFFNWNPYTMHIYP